MNTKDLPVVELTAVGEKRTMCVEQARKLPFGRFPEVEFAGQIGTGERVALVMPMPAAVKQLTNLGLETMNPDGQFMSAVGKYLTIKRSENKTNPARPYWDIYLAREGEFGGDANTATPAPKPQRVATPAKDPVDEFADEMRAEGAANRARQEERAAARVTESQARPRAAEPVTAEELTDVDKKKRARMVQLRTIWRGLWKQEAIAQLSIALEIAKEHPELPRVNVTAESINAGTATQFIEFNRNQLT